MEEENEEQNEEYEVKMGLGRYVNSRTSKRSMEKRRWQRIMGKRRRT